MVSLERRVGRKGISNYLFLSSRDYGAPRPVVLVSLYVTRGDRDSLCLSFLGEVRTENWTNEKKKIWTDESKVKII